MNGMARLWFLLAPLRSIWQTRKEVANEDSGEILDLGLQIVDLGLRN